MATRDVDSARHAGIIALVQQHFDKAGDFPAEVARTLPRSSEKRLSSEYSDFVEISGEEVARVRTDVHAFVLRGEKIRKALDLTSWEAASNLIAQWNGAGEIGVVRPDIP